MFRYIVDKYFIKQPAFRRAVTSLLYRNRDLDVTLCGTRLHVNSRRENGYLRASKAISWNGTLRDEVPVLMNLMSLIRDGDSFVDAGANVGLFTHTFSRFAALYPRFTVDAFEPHPSTFARLSFHNQERVTYHNFGLGPRNETLQFVDGAVSHVFTEKSKANSYNIPGELISVDVRRLDEVSLPSGPVVLKIDVEGQELSVLEGAEKLFRERRVKCVYFDGYENMKVHEVLQDYGFELRSGLTFEPIRDKVFSLLAINKVWLSENT